MSLPIPLTPADQVPARRPRTVFDTLSSLVGGRPTVMYGTPPAGPQAGGEWRNPTLASKGDSVYVDPAFVEAKKIPADFLLSHEMGHRLYDQVDPEYGDRFRPSGAQPPQLSSLVDSMRDKDLDTQDFAIAFSNALSRARATPTNSGFRDKRGDAPANKQAEDTLLGWILKQPIMAGRDARFAMQKPDATAVVAAPERPNR